MTPISFRITDPKTCTLWTAHFDPATELWSFDFDDFYVEDLHEHMEGRPEWETAIEFCRALGEMIGRKVLAHERDRLVGIAAAKLGPTPAREPAP